jgi:DNA-binding response OmpR family regulator
LPDAGAPKGKIAVRSASFATRGSGARVLVVDEEVAPRERVRDTLERDGFRVTEAADGESALDRVGSLCPDLIVLDLSLGRASGRLGGVEVLRRLRASGQTPVIVLSGDDDAGGIVGLETGADDFLVKPFSGPVLVARARALLRRAAGHTASVVLEYGAIAIDVDAREVMRDGEVIACTAREFDLLVFLASSPGEVFSAEELLRAVWGSDPSWQRPSTVGEHIYRLRRKLEAEPSAPQHLVTVRGAGYRFQP